MIFTFIGLLTLIPYSFASESKVIQIFQPDVELLPDDMIEYGESFTIHAWLQSYDNRPDDLGFYVDVLNPQHNQIDSTLWFAKSDFIYEFDTTHPAYNITQSGTYYVQLEKANFHERTGSFPKTITFEILFPEPKQDKLSYENCGPGTVLQDGVCVVTTETESVDTNVKWGETLFENPPPDLDPVVDYDYELIYVTVILTVTLIGGIVGGIIFVFRRNRK